MTTPAKRAAHPLAGARVLALGNGLFAGGKRC
jgi:hypothetical protein